MLATFQCPFVKTEMQLSNRNYRKFLSVDVNSSKKKKKSSFFIFMHLHEWIKPSLIRPDLVSYDHTFHSFSPHSVTDEGIYCALAPPLFYWFRFNQFSLSLCLLYITCARTTCQFTLPLCWNKSLTALERQAPHCLHGVRGQLSPV